MVTFSWRDGTDLDTGENNFFGEENVGFGGAGVLGVHALGGVPQVLPLRPGQEHHMPWLGQVTTRISGCSKNLHICIVTEVNFLGRIILLICKLKLVPPNSTKSPTQRQRIIVLQSQVHSLLSVFNTHDFYSVLFYLFNFDQRSKKHLALLKWSRDLSLKKRFNQPENQINPNTKYDTDVCYNTPLLEFHQGSHWLSAKPGRSGEFSSFQYPTFDHWHLKNLILNI